MPRTVNSLLVLGKFRQLVEELYGEPKNEEILGLYFHADINNHPPVPMKINKKNKENKKMFLIYLVTRRTYETFLLMPQEAKEKSS